MAENFLKSGEALCGGQNPMSALPSLEDVERFMRPHSHEPAPYALNGILQLVLCGTENLRTGATLQEPLATRFAKWKEGKR